MAARLASSGSPLGPLVLAAALAPLFVHADFQPSLDVGSVTLRLADLAVAAVAAAAAAELRRTGVARLRAGLWIWVALAAFFAVVALSIVVAAASDRAYPLGDHLVTAAKYAEYAVLALAVPVLIRGDRDARAPLAVLIALSVIATIVGLLQLVGVPLFDEWPAGRRQASFLGHHDFAALSGAALALGFAALALGERRPNIRGAGLVAGVSGGLGLIVSGAVTGAAGAILTAAATLAVAHHLGLLTRARTAAVVLTTLVVVAGVLAIRSPNLAEQFDDETGAVETFSHRGVLAYIGVREFADHPLTGIGWQASLDEAGYGPYLDDARRRYPEQPDRVFPSPDEPWGIQNAYLQALAELGVLGGVAILGLLAAGARTALRAGSAAVAPALVGTLWLCIVAGIWNGVGLIAGLPLDAVLWLALGVTAAAAAGWETGSE